MAENLNLKEIMTGMGISTREIVEKRTFLGASEEDAFFNHFLKQEIDF